ncbi:MAG: serine/threonine protein kinase [Myxococcales bacterium]|nr:serine/threonine protein kinase [Myxococcales bacterium]MBK7196144.1 serine/threonine protein kinase [Myxococcales bacterium]MBP6842838.1 serine/threonine protein kinase [Kofleriaceae bacterium]
MSGRTPANPAVERQAALDRADHLAEVTRTRLVFKVGIGIWIAFAGADAFVHWRLGYGELWVFMLLRAIAVAWMLTLMRILGRVPSRVALPWLTASGFVLSALLLSIMAVGYRGIASPYGGGVLLILFIQSMTRADPWRRGAVYFGVTAAMYGAVMGVATIISPTIRAQFADEHDRTTFLLYQAYFAGGWLMSTWAGQVVWGLRQRVYESRSIGRYRLGRRIARGGMGEVWQAYDRGLRRDVALKILHPEQGQDPQAIARFEREVRATAELSHPNTVRLFDYGVTDDGVWYYAMELLHGRDLGALVERDGPMPIDAALGVVAQIAGALAEAHARGILHRDLKPANVFVVELAGQPAFAKLLDFGIARRADPREDDGVTQSGVVIGTPAYMAPEVLGGAPATTQADVYGLGGLLWFALTGTPPRDRRALPVADDRDRATVQALDALLSRCLAATPTHRFADALAVMRALQGLRGAPRHALPPLVPAGVDTSAPTAPLDAAAAEPTVPLPTAPPERA